MSSEGQDVDASTGRLGRDTLIYGLGFVLQRAAGLIMLPIYTRYLSAADFGVLELLQMSFDVVTILLAGGVTAGVYRYYFKYEAARERSAVAVGAWLLLLVFNLLGALLLVAVAEPVATHVLDDAALSGLVYILALSFALDPLLTLPVLLMQIRQRAVLYTVVSLTRLGLQIALNVLFVVFLDEGVRGVLLSTVITYALLGPVLLFWFFRQTGFVVIRSILAQLFWFGLPYRLTDVGTFTLTFVDRYFLKFAQGLAVTGVYSLAYKFGFLLAYLGQVPFLMAWNPQRFSLVDRPKAERDAYYRRGLLFFSTLVLTLAVGISLFVRPVLEIMSSPEFHGAAELVPLILLAYVFQAWTYVLEFGIQVSERTGFVTWATWIAVVVILGLYALLIPTYGAWGAAIATAVAFAIRALAFYIFAQRLWPIDYGWGRSLGLLALAVGVVLLGLWVQPADWPAQIAVAAGLSLFWFVLLWRLGFDADARAGLRAWLPRVWGRLRAAVSSS